MFIHIYGYINIFCSIEHIYFNENIYVLLNKKNEKSICNKRK